MPYNEEPRILTLFEKKHFSNKLSGHSWTEHTDKILGYEVVGGGWMRTKHTTFNSAEKELRLRKQILEAKGNEIQTISR